MAQLSYSRNQPEGMLGLIADSQYTYKESHVAFENLPFGYGAVFGDTTEKTARLPKASLATLLFDADFVTGNTIDLDVNGTSITQVPFNTDHDTTAADLVTAIAALSGVNCELDSSDANNRTFLITTDDAVASVTNVVVAGGASQAGSTVTAGSDDKFLGVVVQSHTVEQTSTGVAQYAENDIASVMRQGKIWVWVEEAVDETKPVYCRFITNGNNVPGYFRTDDDSGKAFLVSNANFRKRTTGAGLTVLEINKP
jgi:hypothetical protein